MDRKRTRRGNPSRFSQTLLGAVTAMPKPRFRPARVIEQRAATGAPYVDRARLHSDIVTEGPFAGCWSWFGHISGGVPRVSRAPKDGKGPINVRVAMLTELHGRPDWAHTASPGCGNPDCVNPEHIRWESKDDFHTRIGGPRVKVSDERIVEAWHQRCDGVPVTEIAARLNLSRSALYARWNRLRLPDTTTM